MAIIAAAILFPLNPSARADGVRIATWNILAAGAPGSTQYTAAETVIERICPDIVAVQEINPEPDTGYFELLTADAGYPFYAVGDVSGTLSGGLRNGVMSTLNIAAVESWSAVDLSGDSQANDITRDILQVRVQINTTDYLGILIVHLKALSGESNRFRRQVEVIRVCQAAAVYRAMYPVDALVIAGDINADINDGPFGTETWMSEPSGLPVSYQLGSDITFPVTYDPFVTLQNAGFTVCSATWEDDPSTDTTYLPDSRLDYVFYDSTELTLTGDEVYYSMEDNGLDDPPAGNWLAKCGSIPSGTVSDNASDHLPVYADFQTEPGTPVATPTAAPTATPTATPTPETGCTPIALIQFTSDPSGDSPLAGSMVTTCGIVTAAEDGLAQACIQDGTGAWSGILIYNAPETLTIGDEIQVAGTVQEYYGMTEIYNITELTILSSGQATPVPVVRDTGNVSVESLESVLVEVTGLTITNDDLGYGEWEVNDGSGPLVVGDYYSYAFVPVTGMGLLYLRGPVFYTFDMFKVQPRSDEDIGVAPVPPTSTPVPTFTPTPVPTFTPTPAPTFTPIPTLTPTPSATATVECLNHGDVNGDGHLSSSDAQITFYFVLQMQTPTYEQACAADCTGNGSLSAGDAQAIFYAVLGVGDCADPIP